MSAREQVMVILPSVLTSVRRHPMLRFGMVFGALLPVMRLVQLQADEPLYFVIRDARIVPIAGPVI